MIRDLIILLVSFPILYLLLPNFRLQMSIVIAIATLIRFIIGAVDIWITQDDEENDKNKDDYGY